jgi:hypothetical protein
VIVGLLREKKAFDIEFFREREFHPSMLFDLKR